jgi:hypothetical protein
MSWNSIFVDNVFFTKLNDYLGENNIKWSLKANTRIFIVTKNDLFYEIYLLDDKIPLFVFDNDNSVIDLMIVKELCNKGIVDITYGSGLYIARSIDDKLYFMGENNSEVNKILSGLKIINLKCGKKHALALTSSGEVYSWGLNFDGQIGNGSYETQLIPIKVNGFDNEKIVMISCGGWHSMVLTESGRVFYWGDNNWGQLAIENLDNLNKPKRIEMNGIITKKISCGQLHNLLLTNDGVIYVFGYNHLGQLGISDRIQSKPMKLNHKNKFIDIASHSDDDISVSLSDEGIYYVWGECKLTTFLTPTRTICKSFDEVFATYSTFQINPTQKLFDFSDCFFRSGYYHKQYDEIDELGSGSFGTVFKAIDKGQNYFAIKKIKLLSQYKNEFTKEFINYSIVTKLSREWIVSHFDAWFENYDYKSDENLYLYIAMELCDKTLKDIIDDMNSDPIFKVNETLTPIGYYIASQLFIEILNGVLLLHQNNLIHKDLYPSNILVKKDGKRFIKIGDFGLTSIHEYAEQIHAKDVGHIKYMAPEVEKSGIYNPKADIYSLGVVLKVLFDIDIYR